MTIHTLNETFTRGLTYDTLTVISVSAIACGIFVIISKNPVVSVLFLIGLFLNIAIYLIMLGINFIGLSYLLVYVGAVSILFLFILMLINVRISELVTDNYNSVPLAIIISIIYTIILYVPSGHIANFSTDILFFYKENISNLGENINSHEMSSIINSNVNNELTSTIFFKEVNLNNDVYYVTTQLWDGALAEFSHITSIGNVLYTVYPLWLILTSLILLLAMVGAIVITINSPGKSY